ncbi:hypothetical protein A2Z33_00030 [Candidatus Gottesmanbacteria bacterium RBG_16_52_11]|uniref:Uncharacterized protein n=1 Tax=Candidatus Gottesmanbacteria bacterium RBG_16_52_11 TaxID=1798374 RepID=A0A1F5YMY3_9BACT|nr:MAG: hypothetical protein A2Z33_00030 [Candidatus Gottesmanbacteria bacterium RBG_16_52_11]
MSKKLQNLLVLLVIVTLACNLPQALATPTPAAELPPPRIAVLTATPVPILPNSPEPVPDPQADGTATPYQDWQYCGETEIVSPDVFNEATESIIAVTINSIGIWSSTEDGLSLYQNGLVRICSESIRPDQLAFSRDQVYGLVDLKELWELSEGKWSEISELVPGDRINFIGNSETVVYAGTELGLATLDDLGWQLTLEPPGSDKEVFSFAIRKQIAYLGTKTDGIWWFDGNSWQHACNSGCEIITSGNLVRQISFSGDIMIVLTENGIDVIKDGMTTNHVLPDPLTNKVLMDEWDRLWAATNNGLFVLNNGFWVMAFSGSITDIAFGCRDCFYNQYMLAVGTENDGLSVLILKKDPSSGPTG